jgi:hypothetical protein
MPFQQRFQKVYSGDDGTIEDTVFRPLKIEDVPVEDKYLRLGSGPVNHLKISVGP